MFLSGENIAFRMSLPAVENPTRMSALHPRHPALRPVGIRKEKYFGNSHRSKGFNKGFMSSRAVLGPAAAFWRDQHGSWRWRFIRI